MAPLKIHKPAIVGAAVLALAVAALGLRSLLSGNHAAPAVGQPAGLSAKDSRRTPERPDRRGAGTTAAAGTLTAPDPTWDTTTAALWNTVLDATQEDVAREAAALKLASRGDRQILERLWALWRQGLLPAGCSWIRDLMAAADGGAEVTQARPTVSPAEVNAAAARAANAALPLDARIEAVRRLGVTQTDEALAILESLCFDDAQAPAALRTAAFAALLQADDQIAIAALAQRLTQGDVPPADELLAMLQAMADEPHSGAREVALPLLQNADADVREEAAWLLTMNSEEATPEDIRTVLATLGKEEDAAVRRRLYSALGEAAAPYADSIVAAVRAEEATSVRLSGYQSVATMAAADDGGSVDNLFDNQVVGELERTALSAPEYQYRFEAVVALKTARTAGAAAALARIAAGAADPRIAQAATVP